MHTKTKVAVALAAGAIFLIADTLAVNAASAHGLAGPHAGAKPAHRAPKEAYGSVGRQVPLYGSRGDVFSSDSLGRQSFPNPDRDYSIDNLSSHAY